MTALLVTHSRYGSSESWGSEFPGQDEGLCVSNGSSIHPNARGCPHSGALVASTDRRQADGDTQRSRANLRSVHEAMKSPDGRQC